jgi:tetratricopeptide (TPR) repeat protein
VPQRGADDRPPVGRLDADVLLASGRWQEALESYDFLLAAGEEDLHRRAELLRGRAEALCRLYRGREAVGSASQAAELFEALGAPADAAWARYWEAGAYGLQDEPGKARAILLELLAAERAGLQVAPDFRFRVLVVLANAESWDGQAERALTYMEEARSLMGAVSLRQEAAFLAGLALQYRHVGDLEGSVRVGQESLDRYRLTDSVHEEAAVENNLAITFIELGSTERAAEHLRRAREIVDAHGNPHIQSEVTEAEARLALARGDVAETLERASAALAESASGGSYLAGVGAHRTLARLAVSRADRREAETHFEAAAALLREHRARALLRPLLAEWADMRSNVGDAVGASALYAEALGRGSRQRR